MSDFAPAGMHVVVLGLARQGEAAARALLDRGASVTVLDRADDPEIRRRAESLPARVVLGPEDPSDVNGADLVVASAGVPPRSSWITAAKASGVEIWSELELAYRIGVRPAIAVTGTKGKTTTTEMTVAALERAGMRAVAAGNIGAPIVAAHGDPIVVVEVSSAQLWGIDRFRAPIAVLTNLAPDHLDWHGSLEDYVRAKARLFANQHAGDTAVFRDDEVCRSVATRDARRLPFADDRLPEGGAGVVDGWIRVPQGRVVEVERLRSRSRPHRAAAVAAAAAACAHGADPGPVGDALAGYRPRPHRIETISTIDGVTYVNDSKATNPFATLAALEGLDDVVLIAGGRNKGLDLGELRSAAAKLRGVVAMGEAAGEVTAAFEGTVPVERAATMEEAVAIATKLSERGGTVLLSPACQSWDMYRDHEERGEAFRAAVEHIEGGRR